MTETKRNPLPTEDELEPKKKKSELDEKAQQCRHGFHDWVEKEGEHLDEQGKPVKMLKCSACGKEKVKSE